MDIMTGCLKAVGEPVAAGESIAARPETPAADAAPGAVFRDPSGRQTGGPGTLVQELEPRLLSLTRAH